MRFQNHKMQTLARTALGVVVAALPLVTGNIARASSWPVFDHDPARSGVSMGDTSFTARNVASLHRRWVATFDDVADSTPIYLPHVFFGHNKVRAMLFQTTKSGTTYAIDARTGAIVWRFLTHGPKITTSTPAADPSGGYIYVPGVDGKVHKLSTATGNEVHGMGFPLRITQMPNVEKDAAALNVANGYLYAATSGYIGDQGPYDGHVVVVRLRDGYTFVFNSLCSNMHQILLDKSYDPNSKYTCSQARSGIWSRSGVVVDPDPSMKGRIYFTTGNGRFDANRGGTDYGDSVVSLSAGGRVLIGYYTPANYEKLQSSDLDLGSTAPVLLPREPRCRTPLMAVQGGKDGVIRLLNRAYLGGVGRELGRYAIPGAILFSAPAVWQQPHAGTWIYFGDSQNVFALRVFINPNGYARLLPVWKVPVGGTSPVVINGVVFAATSGALNALDARTGKLLWTSKRSSAGGTIGGIHWESPIALDGWAFVSDDAKHLSAYALPGH